MINLAANVLRNSTVREAAQVLSAEISGNELSEKALGAHLAQLEALVEDVAAGDRTLVGAAKQWLRDYQEGRDVSAGAKSAPSSLVAAIEADGAAAAEDLRRVLPHLRSMFGIDGP